MNGCETPAPALARAEGPADASRLGGQACASKALVERLPCAAGTVDTSTHAFRLGGQACASKALVEWLRRAAGSVGASTTAASAMNELGGC